MKTLIGIVLLWLILWGVQALLQAIGFYSLPAPIVALALFTPVLLLSKPIAEFTAPAASKLIQYMPLFFIPILVGVMAEQDMLSAHWALLLFAVMGATMVGLVSTALIYWFVDTHINKTPETNPTTERAQDHD